MTRTPVCEFVVEAFLQGKRIDSFLAKHLRNWSPWQIQRMVQAGCVTVGDAPVDNNFRVHRGQHVRIRLVSPPDRVAEAHPLPLTILFEDPWLIVVSKPPGQIAHPGGEFMGRTLLNALQHHVDRQTEQPGMIRPGIVHRIDRQTSGVMVIPKDHYSHRRLTAQFEERDVTKAYLAICEGRLPEPEGLIDVPMGKVPNPTCTLFCAKPVAEDPRSARTEYRVLRQFDRYAFVEARPLTGRHHQIRVHFAEIGHPLLADEFYGMHGIIKDGTPIMLPDDAGSSSMTDELLTRSSIVDPWFDPALPLRRHALHAHRLSIEHPVSGQPLDFEAPLPEDMQSTLDLLEARR